MSGLLRDKEKAPVSLKRLFVWAFIAGFFSLWIIVGMRIDIPEVNAQTDSESRKFEERSLRRRHVEALEEISSTLKRIDKKLSRSE